MYKKRVYDRFDTFCQLFGKTMVFIGTKNLKMIMNGEFTRMSGRYESLELSRIETKLFAHEALPSKFLFLTVNVVTVSLEQRQMVNLNNIQPFVRQLFFKKSGKSNAENESLFPTTM